MVLNGSRANRSKARALNLFLYLVPVFPMPPGHVHFGLLLFAGFHFWADFYVLMRIYHCICIWIHFPVCSPIISMLTFFTISL